MRLGNPCAFCGLNILDGTQRIIKLQSIYHGIGFSIYFALFVAAGARSEQQSVRFYLNLLRTRWPCTAMITIHTIHLLSLLLLWQGHKRSSPTVLLIWLIVFTVLVIAQMTIILVDRSSYLLAQIPLLFFQLYCFWVVWELREHFRFMLNTREEIPMMTLMRIDDTAHCNDRADGEIPPSQVDSSFERFGYQVYTSTVCGYSRIPKDALEIALGPSSSPAFSAYYRTCFCPIPTHRSRIVTQIASSKPSKPPNSTQAPSASAVRLNNAQQAVPGQRVLSVVSRMEKQYRR